LTAIPRFAGMPGELLMCLVVGFSTETVQRRFLWSYRMNAGKDKEIGDDEEEESEAAKKKKRKALKEKRAKEGKPKASPRRRRGQRRRRGRDADDDEESESEEESPVDEESDSEEDPSQKRDTPRFLDTAHGRFDVRWLPVALSTAQRQLNSNCLRSESSYGESAMQALAGFGEAADAFAKLEYQLQLQAACQVYFPCFFYLFFMKNSLKIAHFLWLSILFSCEKLAKNARSQLGMAVTCCRRWTGCATCSSCRR